MLFIHPHKIEAINGVLIQNVSCTFDLKSIMGFKTLAVKPYWQWSCFAVS